MTDNRIKEREEALLIFRGFMYGTLFSLPIYATIFVGAYYLCVLLTH